MSRHGDWPLVTPAEGEGQWLYEQVSAPIVPDGDDGCRAHECVDCPDCQGQAGQSLVERFL